jgi:hypothetical protein
MERGDTIYYFEIKLDFLKNQAFQSESVHTVLGVNEQRFVIDDSLFTRVQFKDEQRPMYGILKKAQVSKFHLKPYWDELKGYMYTTNSSKKVAHNAIKKALESFLYENYGRYCGGIKLLETIV